MCLVATTGPSRAQTAPSRIDLRLYDRIVQVESVPGAEVAVDVLRPGSGLVARGSDTVGSDGTAIVALDEAMGSQPYPLPRDRIVVRQGAAERTIDLPGLFVDVDAETDAVAGLVDVGDGPPPSEVAVHIEDTGRAFDIAVAVAANGTFLHRDPALGLGPSARGYVRLDLGDGASLSAPFAALRLEVDVADGRIRGWSSPDALLGLTVFDGSAQVEDVQIDAGAAIGFDGVGAAGAAAWSANIRSVQAGGRSGGLAGLTLRVAYTDFLVPDGRAVREFALASLAFEPTDDGRLAVAGAIGEATASGQVRSPFGETAERAVSVSPSGQLDAVLDARPGDRLTIDLAHPDGLVERHAYARHALFVVPHAASLRAFGPSQTQATFRLLGADGAELAAATAQIEANTAATAFGGGALAEPGMAIEATWSDGTTARTTLPEARLDALRDGSRLEGVLPPGAAFDVYREMGDDIARLGTAAADGAGSVAFDVAPPLGYGERGAVLADLDSHTVLALGWTTLHLDVDLVDALVGAELPVGRELEVAWRPVGSPALPPRRAVATAPTGARATTWLADDGLPLRRATVMLAGWDEAPERRLGAGDEVIVQVVGEAGGGGGGGSRVVERIGLSVPALEAVVDADGRLRGTASAPAEIVAVVGGPGVEPARQALAYDAASGTFEGDVSALLALPGTQGTGIEWLRPEATVRTVAVVPRAEIGLPSGEVSGLGPTRTRVRVVFERAGRVVADRQTESAADGAFALPPLLWGDGAMLRVGDVVRIELQHPRLPQQRSASAPGLTLGWQEAPARVVGTAPGAESVRVSASDRRLRLLYPDNPNGATPQEIGAEGNGPVDPDGAFAIPLASTIGDDVVLRPGTWLRAEVDGDQGIRFWRGRHVPIVALEQGGARVAMLSTAGDAVAVEALSAAGAPAFEVATTADASGRSAVLLGGEGSPLSLGAGDRVVMTTADAAIEVRALPRFDVTSDWSSDAVAVSLPGAMPLYTNHRRCIPWGDVLTGLRRVPDTTRDPIAVPIPFQSTPAGMRFALATFDAAGQMIWRTATKPLGIVDPAGIVRGCTDPLTAVDVVIEDEDGNPRAQGRATADARGWFAVPVLATGRPARIQPTDAVLLRVGDYEVRLPEPSWLEVERTGGELTVTAAPGRRAFVMADTGDGYAHRTDVTTLDAGGHGALALPETVDGAAVRRALVVTVGEGAEGEHEPFTGTEIMLEQPPAEPRGIYLPFGQRP